MVVMVDDCIVIKSVKVELLEEDYRYIVKKCGKHGIDLKQLIENFLGDFSGQTVRKLA